MDLQLDIEKLKDDLLLKEKENDKLLKEMNELGNDYDLTLMENHNLNE